MQLNLNYKPLRAAADIIGSDRESLYNEMPRRSAWGKPNLHVTVHRWDNLSCIDIAAIVAVASTVLPKRTQMITDGLALFGTADKPAIVVRVRNSDLKRLHSDIKKLCAVKPLTSEWEYNPHMTLLTAADVVLAEHQSTIVELVDFESSSWVDYAFYGEWRFEIKPD